MRDEDVNEGGRGRAHCGCCGGHGGEAARAASAAREHRGEAGGGEQRGGAGGRGGEGFFGAQGGTARALGAGALIAAGAMLFAANRDKLKPLVKGTVKEYYRFTDWLGAHLAEVKEDLSDMAAEARHEHEQETAAHLEMLDRERQLVQRLANMAKKRSEES
jgi:hypothetical protein